MINETTETIISKYGTYHETPQDFFSLFDSAWDNAQSRILKLETRQKYQEPNSESYQAFMAGNSDTALSLIEESRQHDIKHYAYLQQRNVDFIRCRPIIRPFSEYLKWEMEVYKFNKKYGEKIYFTEDLTPFQTTALHDFMVFDHSLAFVHNYDPDGLIQGGWTVESSEGINSLIKIYEPILATATAFNPTS